MAATTIPYVLTHRVIRPFNGDGSGMLQTGQCIDASDWRNANALVNTKYLIPLTPDEAERELEAMKAAAKRKPEPKPPATAKPFGSGGKPQQEPPPPFRGSPPPANNEIDAQDEIDLDEPKDEPPQA